MTDKSRRVPRHICRNLRSDLLSQGQRRLVKRPVWGRLWIRGTCLCSVFLMFLLSGCAESQRTALRQRIELGGRPASDWNHLLSETSAIGESGRKIARLSAAMLGTPYQENSLRGGIGTEEVLVLDLAAVDCFTLLDYVEALRRSSDLASVQTHLRNVRYRDGVVSYSHRNHFFSDWQLNNAAEIENVTADIGKRRVLTVQKRLNLKSDGSLWLPGLPVRTRAIGYLPVAALEGPVMARLRTGDYLGVYSEKDGLDVSHTGIVIRKQGELFLRHASSSVKARQVLDSNLVSYLRGKPGIVVFRAK